jgi:hypothetical protein
MPAVAFRFRHRIVTLPRFGLGCAFAATVTMAGAASAQVVAGWAHESVSGVEFAYFTRQTEELTVRCKGPAVEVVYYVDAAVLDPALKGRSTVVLAVSLDNATDFLWTSSRLVAESGIISIGVGGSAASDLAHDLAAATRSIAVSILDGPPQADSVPYNRVDFPIYGAADSIKAAYAGCGIKY